MESSIDQGQLKLNSVAELSERVLRQTKPEGATALVTELESFRSAYSDLKNEIATGKARVQQCRSSLEDFNKLQEATRAWMRDAELKLKTGSIPKRDLAEKKIHLEKMKVSQLCNAMNKHFRVLRWLHFFTLLLS